jgi:hypothetical protein
VAVAANGVRLVITKAATKYGAGRGCLHDVFVKLVGT